MISAPAGLTKVQLWAFGLLLLELGDRFRAVAVGRGVGYPVAGVKILQQLVVLNLEILSAGVRADGTALRLLDGDRAAQPVERALRTGSPGVSCTDATAGRRASTTAPMLPGGFSRAGGSFGGGGASGSW